MYTSVNVCSCCMLMHSQQASLMILLCRHTYLVKSRPIAHHAHKQQCSHNTQLHTWRQPVEEPENTSALGLLRAAAAAAAAGPAAHQQPLLLLLLLRLL
jgi:hypothetical protein